MDTTTTLEQVRTLVAETLAITDRIDTLRPDTALLGSLPELDSFAVVELITAIEERFGFQIDDADFSADVFATLGTLSEFVAVNRG